MCKNPILGFDPFHLAVAQDRAQAWARSLPTPFGGQGRRLTVNGQGLPLYLFNSSPRFHTFQIINCLLLSLTLSLHHQPYNKKITFSMHNIGFGN